ncbi:TetR/AcrR family transcriptional regulator [Nocardia jejuensis]|uniref:TetR/AcrR family transcriptional regulator n=1 Tax=Nocardia jejuensis TaxID=328049 RepID=UPI000834EEFD|nr:TetR/AcrR family transcriptional regulator [Nocardia jejuensis]
MASETNLVRPGRGTRPANRRQLIVDAATELFCDRGYGEIGMGDVAESVGMGPSALYRHFRGKQELLATVIDAQLTRYVDVAQAYAADPGRDLPGELAATVLDRRGVGVLWRRETRNLTEADSSRFLDTGWHVAELTATAIRARRPELDAAGAGVLAFCVLAVANSASLHTATLPEPAMSTLLAELIATVIATPLPVGDAGSPQEEQAGISVHSRREAIVTESVKLFATKGFGAASMEDIGSAVGIAGQSVYNHFPSKADILAAAIGRGAEGLWIDLHRTFARARDPRDGLTGLLAAYREFVFDNPQLMQILVSDMAYLPEAELHRARTTQHDYIAEWCRLLRTLRPEFDGTTARIRVQAAQVMLSDVASTPQLRRHPGIDAILHEIGGRLLTLPDA